MSAAPFDPAQHMRKIRTRQGMMDYLDVRWRLMWLRSEHPDANVVTEVLDADAEHARFKCTISFVTGITRVSEGPAHVVVGTGHGSETKEDFPDFFEKAETKSVGRACAMIGYGTDSAMDLDDGEPMDGLPAAQAERSARRDEIRQNGEQQYNRAAQAAPPAPAPSAQRNAQPSNGGGGSIAPARPAGLTPLPQNSPSERLPSPRQMQPSTEGQGTGVRALREAAQYDLSQGTPHARNAPTPLESSVGPVPERDMSGQPSNVHQHAQIRALQEAGVDVPYMIKRDYKVETIEALSRDQAKEVIVKGRNAMRGTPS